MTRNSGNFLTAAALLAGLAIFGIDAAQAGPNGPSFSGGGASFSSMRMDFARIGSPTVSRSMNRGTLEANTKALEAAQESTRNSRGQVQTRFNAADQTNNQTMQALVQITKTTSELRASPRSSSGL